MLDPDLKVSEQVLAQVELHPHVVQIDERDQRDAGEHELAVLDGDAENLAGGRRHDDHLVNQRLERVQVGLGALDLGLRDAEILTREAGDSLVVGKRA